MAGLDELFPDAAERPGVVVPGAPAAEPVGSRRLGILALVLGLFGAACQLGALLTGIAVFVSILKAGAHIPPHTGVTNVRSIVHLPLIVPDGCTFRVGGDPRPWVEGQAFVFDDTIEHEASNPTDRDRAVLILDVWNPYLSESEQAMIGKIYAVTGSLQEPMRAD